MFVCRCAALLILLASGVHTALPRLSAAAESAEPYPITPALTAPFAYGVASGDMTSDSAVLWTHTPGPATVMPELSLTPAFDRPQTLPAATASEASDYTVKVLATGLQPGTQYFFRFKSGSDV